MQTQSGPKVGFIGLGKMGEAMAKNLLTSGKCTLSVYNRTRSAADGLAALGAHVASDPIELKEVDILVTMLANDVALESCVVASGLLEAMGKFREASSNDSLPIHVSCSTLPVSFVEKQVELHKQHHVHYVSLPVAGRPDVAAAGKLHLFFAGNPSLLPILEPLLIPAVGQSIRNYGENPVNASLIKIAFNFTLVSTIECLAEGCALVKKYGMDAKDYTSLLSETLFNCTAFNGYGALISEKKFLPAGASLEHVGLKDTKLALEAGERARVPLPIASLARDHFIEAIATGMADWDWSAMSVVLENHAGIKEEN